ncbi:P-loop containing nucleoside triphosphate hydrolase protein [Rutstroemia sp. NJR-2017a BBW]|nr:P-loop containing nucleoside triphosphate hydrolase protein [Rutstroemia sp. NJR-2017a BBW]
MSPYDEFINVTTHPIDAAPANPQNYTVPRDFYDHSTGKRAFTEAALAASIRLHHPNHHVTITYSGSSDLIAFASARDDASYTPHGNENEFLTERSFVPPSRRYGGDQSGSFFDYAQFACYDYKFKGNEYLIYIIEGDYTSMMKQRMTYILVPPSTESGVMTAQEKEQAQQKTDELLEAATKWAVELHDEVLVFDGGYWQKNKELWDNVQKSRWEDVILEEGKKKALIGDMTGFFDGEEKYKEFGVPWKRGIIFYGPPGNGKTISTKALMHDLSLRTSPSVSSLYVKSFQSWQGPEYGIRSIFLKARQMAPCLLIFEDIDSLVNVSVRSYFLNEVDGLESNHGILMIGSTNHLERLDPGIAKRPSRFDRKYFFDVPNREERVQYARYWREKLRGNKRVEFPEVMMGRVADITGGFSFAYMKEAFVAALLVIVAKTEEEIAQGLRKERDELKDNVLWLELQKQVESLRKEMEEGGEGDESIGRGLNMTSLHSPLNTIENEEPARGRLGIYNMETSAPRPL